MFPVWFVPWLLRTKRGQQVMAGAAIAVLLGVAFLVMRHQLIERGKELGRAEQLEADMQAWEQDRAAYRDALREQSQQIAKARELIIQYQAALVAAKAKIDAIEGEKDAAVLAVARIPDAGLLADIRARLGSDPQHLAPSPQPRSPAELRALDSCLAELPLEKRQNAALLEMVTALQGQTAAQQIQLAATEAQRDAAVGYANRLETHYVAAYNLAQKVRRRPLILKILTFGLLKDPKVNLPDPVSLKSSS